MSNDVRGGSATVSEQAKCLCDRMGGICTRHMKQGALCRRCLEIQQALDAARAEGAKALEEEAQTWLGAVERVRAEERQRHGDHCTHENCECFFNGRRSMTNLQRAAVVLTDLKDQFDAGYAKGRAEERQRAARIVREAGESDTFAAIESESAEEIARAIEADP